MKKTDHYYKIVWMRNNKEITRLHLEDMKSVRSVVKNKKKLSPDLTPRLYKIQTYLVGDL